MDSYVTYENLKNLPKLKSPTMVAAFRGWNDAGGSASLAAGFLRSITDADRCAVIDSDPFVDYQQTRPTVQLVDGDQRRLDWPVTEVHASPEHDLLVVLGTEPNLRWRAFAGSLVDVANQFHARVVVTMGALLADTPHTRPVPVSASASDPELMARHALTPSTYEGPTGIVGVLHDACTDAGLQSASLWAATPHYISAAPNPQAAVALLDRLSRSGGYAAPDERAARGRERVCAARCIGDHRRPRHRRLCRAARGAGRLPGRAHGR